MKVQYKCYNCFNFNKLMWDQMISAIERNNKCVYFIHCYQLEKQTWKVVCLLVPIMFMKCDALSAYSILSIQLSCFPLVSSLLHNIIFSFDDLTSVV